VSQPHNQLERLQAPLGFEFSKRLSLTLTIDMYSYSQSELA